MFLLNHKKDYKTLSWYLIKLPGNNASHFGEPNKDQVLMKETTQLLDD